jgi:hypothetical protein
MESMIDRPDADPVGFLERCHDALRQHTGGNPRPYLDLWSQAEDVSLMGGVGGHQVGIAAVSDLLTAAAKTLNYTTWNAENLVTSFSDTLGFHRRTRAAHEGNRRRDGDNVTESNLRFTVERTLHGRLSTVTETV